MTRLSHRLVFALAFLPLALGAVEARAQSSADLFKGFQTGQKGPVNVEADSLDVVEKDGQRISTFTGNVTVTRGDSVLKAGKISIFSAGSKTAPKAADAKAADANPADAKATDAKPAAANKEASQLEGNLPGAGSFTRIEASGKVYVNSGAQTATGDTAVVDMVGKLVTLSGNVVLSQGPNVITGNKLTWDMTTGRARVDQKPGARIRGIFTPGSAPGKTP
ncbi:MULTISPECIES: LptA/OstA family protein [Kaistia]|jgi:lipopolysaccharide export system protein LptA|uniref:Lipopolysaccharide export system protein LptA n=1 Tax=Kaistia defluvii TaxID=410841 RepID=A0ABV2R2Z9_9HYPH|nr:LptA/OstA family protein [Kaistia sp.]